MNILITGGAAGLGQAITLELAKNKKDKIYFTYFKSSQHAGEIQKKLSNTKGVRVNFLKESDLKNLTSKISSMDLDVLVNNAIVNLEQEAFHKVSSNKFRQNFQGNILPIIKITQAALDTFRKKRFGKIITILSSYLVGNPPVGLSSYVAEKAYLMSLAKSWATEYAKFNITSNCISPSPMQTGLQEKTDPRIIEQMIENHPLRRLLTVKEVAEAVEFYTKCSQQINGNNLIMNAAENVI